MIMQTFAEEPETLDIVDLSLPLTPGMPHFPGSAPLYLAQDQRFAEDGCRTSVVVLGSHAGTHLDAPSHFVGDGVTIGDVELRRCVGEARVLDLSAKQPNEPITRQDLEAFDGAVGPEARLLLRTDWDTHFGADDYFADFPPLAPDVADWLAEQGIWLLGLDIPTLHQTEYAPMHRALLGAGVVIVESLANLRRLRAPRVFFSGAPLKLVPSDGAPIRAVAIDGMLTHA
jgi:kynurenine formamidase